MRLTKEDKNWIQETIKLNNKELILWMSETFITKDDGVTKDYLVQKLEPINMRIRSLQEAVAVIDSKFTESIAMSDNKIFRLEERINALNK